MKARGKGFTSASATAARAVRTERTEQRRAIVWTRGNALTRRYWQLRRERDAIVSLMAPWQDNDGRGVLVTEAGDETALVNGTDVRVSEPWTPSRYVMALHLDEAVNPLISASEAPSVPAGTRAQRLAELRASDPELFARAEQRRAARAQRDAATTVAAVGAAASYEARVQALGAVGTGESD